MLTSSLPVLVHLDCPANVASPSLIGKPNQFHLFLNPNLPPTLCSADRVFSSTETSAGAALAKSILAIPRYASLLVVLLGESGDGPVTDMCVCLEKVVTEPSSLSAQVLTNDGTGTFSETLYFEDCVALAAEQTRQPPPQTGTPAADTRRFRGVQMVNVTADDRTVAVIVAHKLMAPVLAALQCSPRKELWVLVGPSSDPRKLASLFAELPGIREMMGQLVPPPPPTLELFLEAAVSDATERRRLKAQLERRIAASSSTAVAAVPAAAPGQALEEEIHLLEHENTQLHAAVAMLRLEQDAAATVRAAAEQHMEATALALQQQLRDAEATGAQQQAEVAALRRQREGDAALLRQQLSDAQELTRRHREEVDGLRRQLAQQQQLRDEQQQQQQVAIAAKGLTGAADANTQAASVKDVALPAAAPAAASPPPPVALAAPVLVVDDSALQLSAAQARNAVLAEDFRVTTHALQQSVRHCDEYKSRVDALERALDALSQAPSQTMATDTEAMRVLSERLRSDAAKQRHENLQLVHEFQQKEKRWQVELLDASDALNRALANYHQARTMVEMQSRTLDAAAASALATGQLQGEELDHLVTQVRALSPERRHGRGQHRGDGLLLSPTPTDVRAGGPTSMAFAEHGSGMRSSSLQASATYGLYTGSRGQPGRERCLDI